MPPPPLRSLRVAVIGGGPAGLSTARELRREGHAPVVFERGGGVGGTWVYGARSSALYASLRTNLPRELMGFLDFPFAAAEYSADARRFPRHEEVLRYVEEFARRFDLYALVRLNTEVIAVRRQQADQDHQAREPAAGRWSVRFSRTRRNADGGDADAEEGEEEEQHEEVFDAVVVCNGHYADPRIADIPGMDTWPGKQMHSRSYRVPGPFRGQVVVVVGASNSGRDISRDVAGVAREVHVANRSSPAATCEPVPGYPNLWLRSMVERVQEDGSVVFRDGSAVRADAIVHCTGYRFSFPFLCGDDAGVSVDDNRVHPLYKHVFPPHLAPRLAFIGLPFKVIPFPMFQIQANWVAGALSGRIQLPSEEEMMQDVRELYSELEAVGWPVRYTHCLKYNQFEYDDWVAEQCGHAKIEGWRKEMYDTALRKKKDCEERYREEWDDHHLLEQANQDFQKYL